MAKQQTGQLIWKEGLGWYGRYYANVEGERVRVCRALHTENKSVARRKLAKLIAAGNIASEEAQRPETFQEAAERVVEEQRAKGMASWKDRQHRLRTYIYPRIGSLLPSAVKASHVRAILEEVRELGRSRQTMIHVKNDVSVVLKDLWKAELLPENVCQRVDVEEATPEATEQSKKERAVLTDNELVLYLAWQHPDDAHRMATLERQTMAVVARCFGGLRTSDLHAVKWEGFSLPDFELGYAPRRKGARLAKGGKPQRLTVPEVLRPFLVDWWQRHGRPETGLVFPLRRGDQAGKGARKHSSHAEAFRTDLKRAFGVEARVWKDDKRSNGREHKRQVWETVRELTPRERVLLEETEYSLPVDWHSWRRAFNQALGDSGVNAQQAMKLSGHASTQAHERYLQNTQKLLTIPVEALPSLTVVSGHKPMGTLPELAPVGANDEAETAPEVPLKIAVGFEVLALGAGCWRFKSSHPDPTNPKTAERRAQQVPCRGAPCAAQGPAPCGLYSVQSARPRVCSQCSSASAMIAEDTWNSRHSKELPAEMAPY